MRIIKHGFVSPAQPKGQRYNAWPTVISLSDGTLLAAWSGERLKHICPFGKVLASRSTDGGYTWGEPCVIQNTPLDDRDGGLCEIAPGKIMMSSFCAGRKKNEWCFSHWLHNPRTTEERKLMEDRIAAITDQDEARYLGPTMTVSKDNGHTFSAPAHVPLTSPHGPMITKNGDILHIGSLGSTEKGEPGIYVERLDENCNVIGAPQLIMSPPDKDTVVCEPYAAEMPNGDILAAIRVQNKCKVLYTVYLSRSTDGGKTFSAPQPTGWNGMPPHIFVTSKNEVIASYGVRLGKKIGIRVRTSRDNGYTWSEEISLRDDGLDWDLGYPTTTENKNGDLVTVYYMKDNKSLNENRIQYTVWTLD